MCPPMTMDSMASLCDNICELAMHVSSQSSSTGAMLLMERLTMHDRLDPSLLCYQKSSMHEEFALAFAEETRW